MTTEVQRFIDLTPRGALLCAGGSAIDMRGRLLHALLQREPEHQWHGEELMRLLPLDSEHAARALFGLHREGYIDVSVIPPASHKEQWDSVQIDLDSMIDEGATLATLLDHDHLVIAQAGKTARWADDPLNDLPEATVQLHIDGGAPHAPYSLALQGLSLERCASLVKLMRRLTRIRSGLAWL